MNDMARPFEGKEIKEGISARAFIFWFGVAYILGALHAAYMLGGWLA